MVNAIELLAFDVDGVLTDGTAVLAADNHEGKRISFRDLDAVNRAKRAGLAIALITGEDTPAVDQMAHRFGIPQVIRGAKDKLAALEKLASQMGLPLEAICYVGDDDRDAPALSRVGLGLAPANASPTAKAAAHRVLRSAGGFGAVAEAVSLLLQLRADDAQDQSLQATMHDIIVESLEAHRRLLDESLPVLVRVALEFVRAIRRGNKILLFGNGGSAAEAQHVAGELVGRFFQDRNPWPAIALTTDTSILTAIGNDWEFSEVFARQVRALARPADVVVGISTSGRSPNVLKGLEAAKACGATTIGFTGSRGGDIAKYSDLCFRAPAERTPRIQELNLLAWHAICELVEQRLVQSPLNSGA